MSEVRKLGANDLQIGKGTVTSLGGKVVQGAFDYQTPGGVRLEMIHGEGRVSKMSGGTETSLETFMEPTAVIRGAVFMGQLFLTNGVDMVRSTDGINMTLIPAAPLGRLIHLYNDHLFIANIPDFENGPSKLFNSGLRDPTAWSVLNVYNVDTNNAEEITALFEVGDFLAVAKNDSITFLRGNFFDATSANFDAIRLPVDSGVGVVSQGTVVDDDVGGVLFLNEQGFYRLSGPGRNPVRISSAINELVNKINFAAADLFTSVRVEALKEIWWCVAVNGSPTPNLILRYNYLYQTPERVGSWWTLDLADVRSIWSFVTNCCSYTTPV